MGKQKYNIKKTFLHILKIVEFINDNPDFIWSIIDFVLLMIDLLRGL